MTSIAKIEEHAELDAALAARGYRHDAPTLVMTAPVADVAAAEPAVEIVPELTPDWRAAYGFVHSHRYHYRVS